MRFELLVDLGIITVPDDYIHKNQLRMFREQRRDMFREYNIGINDRNFGFPSRILNPGEKISVRAFRQIVDGIAASQDHMAFLATQNAIYTGAQGASLVFEQKRDHLPKGKWYASFDEENRLWYSDGHRMPSIYCDSDGSFDFNLGYLEGPFDGRINFFCFNEV